MLVKHRQDSPMRRWQYVEAGERGGKEEMMPFAAYIIISGVLQVGKWLAIPTVGFNLNNRE